MVGATVSFLPLLGRFKHILRTVNVITPGREYFGTVACVLADRSWVLVLWNEYGQQFMLVHKEEITGVSE
jgi:hypothetical protein